jgi:hypothetical protein
MAVELLLDTVLELVLLEAELLVHGLAQITFLPQAQQA